MSFCLPHRRAYSYSQGLEGAVDAGLIHDAVSARAWIQSGFETAYCFSWLENQGAEAGDEPYRTRKLQELRVPWRSWKLTRERCEVSAHS